MRTQVRKTRPGERLVAQGSAVRTHVSRGLQAARAGGEEAHSARARTCGTSRSTKTSSWATTCSACGFPASTPTTRPVVVTHHADGRGPAAAALELHAPATRPCEHVGAAFSLILEEQDWRWAWPRRPSRACRSRAWAKQELVRPALAERAERAEAEKMKVASADAAQPWTDYTVTSALSGKTLPRGAARPGAGRVVLLVPRFPHQHAGHLQARDARRCARSSGSSRRGSSSSPIAASGSPCTCATTARSRCGC